MASIKLPDNKDTSRDLLVKILQTLNTTTWGITSNADYAAAVQAATDAGLDASDPGSIVAVSSGAAGRVGGFTTVVYSVPTVDTAAYADGDALGASYKIIAPFRQGSGTGIIQTLTAVSPDVVAADFDIYLMQAAPVASQAAGGLTDNDALVLTDADAISICGRITVASTDWVALDSTRYIANLTNLGIAASNSQPTSEFGYLLYYVMIARGAITFTGSDSLKLKFGVLQD